ncbi:GLPGLI family protein [Pedobacter fastidiosus]|uniref:GLPGLI family protein n=1 Tax=Pedobacter fastidiosus TaxID=2765361 RepID=A0ABR7KNE0_9SPHI|nr:GLPGLI family protein [Pedobacter fastidiosus]MBC6109593.1 GLPGLI family protein [Pedobacter fastidiosus]
MNSTKNKIIKISLSLIFFSTSLFAQLSGTINYKFIVVDPVTNTTNITNSILYITDNKSLQIGIEKNISPQNLDDNTIIEIVKGRPIFIFKNFKMKTLLLSDYVGLKTRLIEDTLLNFKWVITKEKKKILNFNCTKARVDFRGRQYEAWFTNDIPIQNGPWKFCGLPGLIIKINDEKRIFTYELTGIDLKTKIDKNILTVPLSYLKDTPITHKEYTLLLNKKILAYQKMARVIQTGKEGTYPSPTVILPTKQEKF